VTPDRIDATGGHIHTTRDRMNPSADHLQLFSGRDSHNARSDSLSSRREANDPRCFQVIRGRVNVIERRIKATRRPRQARGVGIR
jgi:hypothetical protein